MTTEIAADVAADVVVVGGGTAGCTVAARLADDCGLRVVLIERGPLTPRHPPVDPFPDIAEGRVVEELDVVSGAGTAGRRILSAARLGGGSAVNGLIAESPIPAEFERWQSVHGCHRWSWNEVAGDAREIMRMFPSMSAPEGPLGRALADAAPEARPAQVALRLDRSGSLHRVSCIDRLSRPLAAETLRILGATATRLETVEGGVRVVTDSGAVHGRDVVLCAGALRTPHLLATVGRVPTRPGNGLMNHLGVMLPIDRGAGGAGGGRPPVSTVLDVFDDAGVRFGQVIAFEHIDATRRWAGLAAVLLRTVSRGVTRAGSTPVTVRMEIDDRDIRSLGVVVRRAVDALAAVESSGAGLPGRLDLGPDQSLRSLRTATDAALGEWIRNNIWHLSHGVGTCAMGGDRSMSIVDDRGRVRGHDSLWIADGSVMPEIVASHPNTTIAVVAHRIAGFLAEERG